MYVPNSWLSLIEIEIMEEGICKYRSMFWRGSAEVTYVCMYLPPYADGRLSRVSEAYKGHSSHPANHLDSR